MRLNMLVDGHTQFSAAAFAVRLMCLPTFVALCVCGGCDSRAPVGAKPAAEGPKKSERPKPPFEPFRVFAEPNEKSFTQPNEKDSGRVVQAVKPGHWSGVLVETKANLFDFSGELNTVPLDSRQNPVNLDRSPFYLVTSRGATLPKGQRKSFEALFYAPRTVHTTTQISNRLDGGRQGSASPAFGEILSHMPAYQYFMVVLARDPNRYRYLKVLESARPIGETMPLNPEDAAYYRLVMPDVSQPLALPAHPLCWTSVAYVVWDDVQAAALSLQQQQALVDWLHWGGGLIISGPGSLDSLRGTFLAAYLPATATVTTNLEAASLAELNHHWTLTDERGARQELRPTVPWAVVKLERHPEAAFVAGTGELVVERRIGRGRVVATAFRASEPELLTWQSFDSFFNGCLLGRPARTFDADSGQFEFVDTLDRLDPQLVTQVRYFTRDARDPDESAQGPRTAGGWPLSKFPDTPPAPPADPEAPGSFAQEADRIDALKTQSGVAAWDDFAWISSRARRTLREAAGISVPKRQFVVWMLGVYLLLIVPVNWLVFRLLGRVEWAWFAVPVLAVGWGVAVVWLAQLDIGFARAELEVGVLEVQNGYPRGHLTRYTALYTSLSTSYDARFADASALAQPMATRAEMFRTQQIAEVTLRENEGRELVGLVVSSNSTGLVHSEQMFELGGALRWSPSTDGAALLENGTRLRLADVTVLRRRLAEDETIVDESASLGDLAAGQELDVRFVPHQRIAQAQFREAMLSRAGAQRSDSLDLRRLVDAASRFASLVPGDVRLVARFDGGLVGARVEPVVLQARRATLVVANLEFGKRAPRPDFNLRTLAPVEEFRPAVPDPAALPSESVR